MLVEVPNAPGQTCWLWTEYVTVQGDVSTLPVATPPPTPTPAVVYSISYLGIEPCTGYSLAFKVINNGAKPLQSYSIVATDQSSGNVETTDSNAFTERVACKLQEERASSTRARAVTSTKMTFLMIPKVIPSLFTLPFAPITTWKANASRRDSFSRRRK